MAATKYDVFNIKKTVSGKIPRDKKEKPIREKEGKAIKQVALTLSQFRMQEEWLDCPYLYIEVKEKKTPPAPPAEK